MTVSFSVLNPTNFMQNCLFSSDMFLLGTALLKFGMGMYTMFYGSQSIHTPAGHVNTPHLGAFNLKVTELCQYF